MTERPKRPGPIYDRVIRPVVEGDFEAFATLLGIPVHQPPVFLPGSFEDQSWQTDLLVRTGPEQLLHMEYMRSPEADMAARMTSYRGQIMLKHPGMRLTQVAIVLGNGRLQSRDDPGTGFCLGLRTIYLRELDPALLLSRPGLAPLAVLSRGTQEERGQHLAATLDLIGRQPAHRRSVLAWAAMTLAPITLDRSTIERIRKENTMTVNDVADFYSEIDFGIELQQRGRQEGRQEGSAKVLLALLHSRFGDQAGLPELADRLARTGDDAAAVEAINAATKPEDIAP
ncbi:hypothetical protein [Kineosporia sp. NBRC 101731]|uniref:hypothetical protein n=1 Tax=Kineosporia sp. NBRC 101731 TaxID=3032199 RepID=UPI0025579A86|nr:hypothetical protein [Kineosporia sp. NBRC 101731]